MASRLLGKIQIESELPRASLQAMTVPQLETMYRYCSAATAQCKADPVVWEFLTSSGYDKRYFGAKDLEVISEVISAKRNMRSVGLANVQESVASLHGTYKWSLEKIEYQLPAKEKVVRMNTVVPVAHKPTRPGTAALRTFICQFYDVVEGVVVLTAQPSAIDLAFEHPQCPLRPAGIKAFLSTLREVLPESMSFKNSLVESKTVSGVRFYDVVGKFLEEVEIGDYFTLHQAFITSVVRGFSLVPAKQVKGKPSPIQLHLKVTCAKPDAVMVMTESVAAKLGFSAMYKRFVAVAHCEPMIFVGGMQPFVNVPETVTDDQFMSVVTAVGTFISHKRGLGPIAECLNYQPLQSAIGREASCLMWMYKVAKRLGKQKIDIVVSSVAVIKILKTQIPEDDVHTKVVHFVNLGKQAKALGPKESGEPRPGAFTLADHVMTIPPPANKKDKAEWYASYAEEYVATFPTTGIFIASVFHRRLVRDYKLYSFKYAYNAIGILSSEELPLFKEEDVTAVLDWASWIKANLLTPKRVLLAAVCPDMFGSTMGNHIVYDKLVVTKCFGTLGSIDAYEFKCAEDIKWNDLSDDDSSDYEDADGDETDGDNDEEDAEDEYGEDDVEEGDAVENDEDHEVDVPAPPIAVVTPVVPKVAVESVVGRVKKRRQKQQQDEEGEEEVDVEEVGIVPDTPLGGGKKKRAKLAPAAQSADAAAAAWGDMFW